MSGQETETGQPGRSELLGTPVRELGLKLEGSPLEKYVSQLYQELERKRLHKFHPACYLSDEWGCPSGEPVIGIPFYLARFDLAGLEKEANDLETAREIMMYLRHEAGHAFNYAYKLYRRPEWKQLFGSFRRPYRDNYRPVPFSRDYVRHLAGWYAQKHPDEDFAETFAVWLTPRSNWKKKYRGWGALRKLKYMDKIARELADVDPVRRRGITDITVDDMEMTVGEFYRQTNGEPIVIGELVSDADLVDIFNVPKRLKSARSAEQFLRNHRKSIVDKIVYWTGAQRRFVRSLMEAVEARAEALKLLADPARESEHMAEIAVYGAALALSHTKGKSVQP